MKLSTSVIALAILLSSPIPSTATEVTTTNYLRSSQSAAHNNNNNNSNPSRQEQFLVDSVIRELESFWYFATPQEPQQHQRSLSSSEEIPHTASTIEASFYDDEPFEVPHTKQKQNEETKSKIKKESSLKTSPATTTKSTTITTTAPPKQEEDKETLVKEIEEDRDSKLNGSRSQTMADVVESAIHSKNGEVDPQALQAALQSGWTMKELKHNVNFALTVVAEDGPTQIELQIQQLRRRASPQRQKTNKYRPQSRWMMKDSEHQILAQAVLSAIRSPRKEVDPAAFDAAIQAGIPRYTVLEAVFRATGKDHATIERDYEQRKLTRQVLADRSPPSGESLSGTQQSALSKAVLSAIRSPTKTVDRKLLDEAVAAGVPREIAEEATRRAVQK